MSDLIDRQAVLDAMNRLREDDLETYGVEIPESFDAERANEAIRNLPSAEPKIIHCKDCRWWDSTNGKKGYCYAAKHGYYSPNWEIHIYRTHYGEFYCADAERRTDEQTVSE